jgi:hypothetical protein
MKRLKFIWLFVLGLTISSNAQSILSRHISLNVDKQKLSSVLSTIESLGQFRFSYNSDIIPFDSLVSIHGNNLRVEDLLSELLKDNFEFRQSGSFLIIRYAPHDLLLIINESLANSDNFTVKGQILDKTTKEPVPKASIYEKNLLVSEISDGDGRFNMRLKNTGQPILLTVSKENYKSIAAYFLAEVNIRQKMNDNDEQFINGNLNGIEKTWAGKRLVTAKQKVQSINIGGFISEAPFQFALAPGLNSHGSLSGQVVNKFSLNAIGAYSAGVEGGEVGLVFNIDKSRVRYFQFGGAFNLVGGNLYGVQIAGLVNYDAQEVHAAQIALGYNYTGRNFQGFQIGGMFNQVTGTFEGMQISLGLNLIGKNLYGVQIGTINSIESDIHGIQIGLGGNILHGQSRGLQIGGIANFNKSSKAVNIAALTNLTDGISQGLQIGAINYARNLEGFQIGLVNLSDKNDGYAIGLINFSRKGYHKFAITSNESTQFNLAYKGGSQKLYNILIFGASAKTSSKFYTGGVGLGTQIKLPGKFSLNPELSCQYVYQGKWDYLNLLNKFDMSVNFKLTGWLAVQSGPSINVYYSKQNESIESFGLIQNEHRGFLKTRSYTMWFGGHVGLVFF